MAAAADTPTSASKLLTINQYLVDIRESRQGLQRLVPLLESASAKDCEAFRVELRKPPFSGIRKAASKVILQLDESSVRSSKEKQYAEIKKSLALLDDSCRDG